MNNGLHEHLQVFVAVAHARSLTAASIATGIGQPTISRQLNALEKHLGCRLFQRSTRAISLTEQGETYLRHALRILALNEEAETALQEDNVKLRGQLRVACSNAFGRKLLIPILAQWQQQHPQLHVELVLSDQLTHLIEERVDVAFRAAPLRESSLYARPIGVSQRSIVASRKYLKQYGIVKKPEHLSKHRCIVFAGATQPNIWSLEKGNAVVEVPIHAYLSLSTVDALKDAVLADLGIAIVPTWFWSKEQLGGEIVKILPDYKVSDRVFHAVTTKKLASTIKVRRFVDYVEQSLPTMNKLYTS
jgi:DNA-binding transcriptional LysR family regulator